MPIYPLTIDVRDRLTCYVEAATGSDALDLLRDIADRTSLAELTEASTESVTLDYEFAIGSPAEVPPADERVTIRQRRDGTVYADDRLVDTLGEDA